MFKTRYSSLLILFFAASFSVHARETKAPDPFLTKVYRMLCHEEYDEAADELQKEIIANPKNVPAHLTYLFQTKQQERVGQAFAQKPTDFSKISDVDRIVYVAYMIGTRSVDFAQMRKLLDFKSNDLVTESYRRAYEGSLDIIGSRIDEGVAKLDQAVDALPAYDPVLLSQLLSYALHSKQHAELAAKYEHVSKAFDESDPARSGLKAYEKVVDGDDRKLQEIEASVQDAYEMCPYDPGFAMDHANFLFQRDQKNEARDVLNESIARHTFYPPYMDLLLAEIYDAASDHKKRDYHFARAEAALPYFDAATQKHVKEIGPTHSDFDIKTFVIAAVLAAMAIAIVAYVLMKNRKSGQ